jgi:flagellar basal-body rod modification protein FlgD
MQVSNSALDRLSTATAPAKASSVQSSQELENKFLTLLITQVRNQDPLNPMDNAEMTSQLAQLNMVGGIERLNSSIDGLSAGFRSQQALQAASLVGRSVLVPGSAIDHSGQGGRFGVELDQAVDSMSVSILDGGGNAVERIDLGAQPDATPSRSRPPATGRRRAPPRCRRSACRRLRPGTAES